MRVFYLALDKNLGQEKCKAFEQKYSVLPFSPNYIKMGLLF